MTKVVDPPVVRPVPSARERRRREAERTGGDISNFERAHHQLCEIENMTKEELIALIEREGMEPPGEVYFDAKTNSLKKERLKKVEYLEFVRQKLFSLDSPPIVKHGQKLGKSYCIVSIFKSLQGAVRVVAYDTDRSLEYHLFLTAPRLEDLDILKTPPEVLPPDKSLVFKDFSKSQAELELEEEQAERERERAGKATWDEWSTVLIDRLVLSPQGDLYVGPARLMANGLSKNFCLTGRDVRGREDARKKELSRAHVTAWFDIK